MKDLLRQLLNLRTLDWADEGVRFGFERPLPAWAWALAGFVAVGLAFWTYRRLSGNAAWRAALASLRAATLLALVTLALGPQLVRRTESVERDWVLVLVDRSASLTIEDGEGEKQGATREHDRAGAVQGGARVSREAELRDAIARTWPRWRDLSREREVVWLGFDGGAFDLAVTRSAPGAPASPAASEIESISLGDPAGRRTSLGAALDQALARAAARPVSAVVILTDGRSTDEPARAAIRRLQSDLIPVHTVALGSATPVGDLAIRRTESPRFAFVRDITPVRVELDAAGGALARGGTIRLIDTATGLTLDEQEIRPGEADEASRSIMLTAKGELADAPGPRQWAVEVVPAGGDLISGNNRAEFAVELIDRPLRVLYLDGYPRWEQRYLRNLLIREKSITCSTLMLAPDRRYTQEGDEEIEALPDSPERWAEYDAVILGDLRPEMLAPEQIDQIRQHVAQRGAGLIWIAGPGATPALWWDTALADLFPFTKEATDGGAVGEPLLMRPTPVAERLGVLRLGEPPDPAWPAPLTRPESGWSQLRWAQRLARPWLKPTAEILAEGTPVYGGKDEESWPLVLSMRYGAGRVLYVATDEIWRWRYARGEALPERFWLQMIRLLGREGLARAGRAAVLDAAPRRALVDQPVRIALELLDQALVDGKPPSAAVRLTRRAGADPARERADDPASSSAGMELILRPERADGRRYTGIWLPPEAGEWTIAAADPALAGLDLSASVEVALPDDELRRPETDHALLARLSEQTRGRVFSASNLDDLFADASNLPKRRVTLLNEVTESLWDTPLALIVVVTLLTIEWIGRRMIRLI